MQEKLSKPNQSVEKVMRLIEILAEADAAMRLQDISAAADMPASTALRMLNTLLKLGYVNQDRDTLQYSLSLKFTYVGEKVQKQVNLNRLAHPYLVELTKAIGESSCFAVEQNSEVVYLDSIVSANSILTATQRIGKRAPMYCTGVGKLLLLNYDSASLSTYVSGTQMIRYTDNTITALDELQLELDAIRSRGYALDDEECEPGARCVAAPVYDYTGRVVAGISVTAPSLRLGAERIEAVAPIVVGTAQEISRGLAFQGIRRKQDSD